MRVNVQLIKVANDSHLWADTYDRKLIDIFSVENEVPRGEDRCVIASEAHGPRTASA